jgi:hypothetical protein
MYHPRLSVEAHPRPLNRPESAAKLKSLVVAVMPRLFISSEKLHKSWTFHSSLPPPTTGRFPLRQAGSVSVETLSDKLGVSSEFLIVARPSRKLMNCGLQPALRYLCRPVAGAVCGSGCEPQTKGSTRPKGASPVPPPRCTRCGR